MLTTISDSPLIDVSFTSGTPKIPYLDVLYFWSFKKSSYLMFCTSGAPKDTLTWRFALLVLKKILQLRMYFCNWRVEILKDTEAQFWRV